MSEPPVAVWCWGRGGRGLKKPDKWKEVGDGAGRALGVWDTHKIRAAQGRGGAALCVCVYT